MYSTVILRNDGQFKEPAQTAVQKQKTVCTNEYSWLTQM